MEVTSSLLRLNGLLKKGRRSLRFRHIVVQEWISSSLSPVGRSENSPAIYRWGGEVSLDSSVPKERQKRSISFSQPLSVLSRPSEAVSF